MNDKYVSWRKSTYSNDSGNCVEVTGADRLVGVRDSKQHGGGPILEFTAAVWRKFLAEAKSGKLNL
jgi:Domain of unknown function (DUF397)